MYIFRSMATMPPEIAKDAAMESATCQELQRQLLAEIVKKDLIDITILEEKTFDQVTVEAELCVITKQERRRMLEILRKLRVDEFADEQRLEWWKELKQIMGQKT